MPTERHANVLFVSLDAVRPDHTSVYGYARATTPNLAAFAERAARFTAAYTTSPQSVRSLASVFTGHYGSELDWKGDGPFPRLAPSNTTLAEVLRAQGYATGAFINSSYFSLTPGFFQGFELVQEGARFKDDERVAVSKAIIWLEDRRRREEPFFAWVHLINPHAPYADRTLPKDFGHSEIDRYDEEIAGADAALGDLWLELERLEQDSQPTLVAVFADHGEAFGEHGRSYHAEDLHDEAIRVPLLIRAPGAPTGDRKSLVSLLDLYATTLSFAGMAPAPSTSRSLGPLLLSPDGCPTVASCVRESLRAEVHPTRASNVFLRALVSPPWKLIQDIQHGSWELYDQRADPGERTNLYESSPSRANTLRASLMDTSD